MTVVVCARDVRMPERESGDPGVATAIAGP
jgi:hypothetical protein